MVFGFAKWQKDTIIKGRRLIVLSLFKSIQKHIKCKCSSYNISSMFKLLISNLCSLFKLFTILLSC